MDRRSAGNLGWQRLVLPQKQVRSLLGIASGFGESSVNWRRGLLRVWVVVSILWAVMLIAVIGPSAWDEFCTAPTATIVQSSVDELLEVRCAEAKKNSQPCFAAIDILFGGMTELETQRITSEATSRLGVFILPSDIDELEHAQSNRLLIIILFVSKIISLPLSLIILWLLFDWIIRGFLQTNRKV
jgi:hypothetical protein